MKGHPFIWFVLFFITGILLADFIDTEIDFILLTTIVLLIISALLYFFDQKLWLFPLLIIAVILTGALHVKVSENKYQDPTQLLREREPVKVYGLVTSEKNATSAGGFKFTLESRTIITEEASIAVISKIICFIPGDFPEINQPVNQGNELLLSGKIWYPYGKRNPGGFDYKEYLKRNNIFAGLNIEELELKRINENYWYSFLNFISRIRDNIRESIEKGHSKETAAIIKALLLADKSDIDISVLERYSSAGIAHLLVVSGLHTGMLFLIFFTLFARTGIYFRSILTMTGLILFMFLTFAPIPVMRASAMAFVFLFSTLINRSDNPYNLLAIAVFIILLAEPKDIYSIGFQLSVLSVLGIFISNDIINKSRLKNSGNLFVKYILRPVIITFSAQIATLPIMALYFYKLPYMAFLINLIAVPLTFLLISSGILYLLFAYISGTFATIISAANEVFSSFLDALANFSLNTFGYLSISQVQPYTVIIYYFLLFLLALPLVKRRPLFVMGSLLFLSFLFFGWQNIASERLMPDGSLSVLFLDVGQGDAALVKFADGKTALIDAGKKDDFTDHGQRTIYPALNSLGIESINYGFISHFDNDHCGGFNFLINKGIIDTLFTPLPVGKREENLVELYKRKGVILRHYGYQKISVDDGRIFILTGKDKYGRYLSDNDNERSGVIKISYGESSILFTGDTGAKTEYQMMEQFGDFLDSDLLKVSHHGSKSGTTTLFCSRVNPETAIISCGKNNIYGHPHESVVEILEKKGIKVLRTDKNGALLFQTDGKNFRLVDWK